MQQEEVTTDEQAKQFLQEWAKEEGRFADSHLQSEGFRSALHNYEFKRKIGKSVQEALQFALSLAENA